jgi:hypothetical protein
MTGKRRSTVTLKPPYRQAPTLTTPTFKDEMKANGKPSETPPPENEDIAKLLRALNEDLRADPQDDDLEYEEEEPAGRSRLPLGKIALALVAAGGIAVGVVYLGSGDPAPVTTAANNSAPMVPAPAITRAPSNQTSPTPAPATGSLPTPATTPPAAQIPTIQTAPTQTAPSAAPPPPVAALPASTPPVLKVPEPPAVPATAPAAAPKPRVTAESTPSAPAVQKPEAPKPETAKPEAPADTGSLQAMLAPPKEVAKRPPAATPAAPAPPPPAAPSGNGEAKPTAKAATPSAPSAPPPAGRYTVQVGSFSVTANADSLVQRLQGNGFQAYTVDWTDSSNRAWRAVRVGGYPDPAAAKREAEQLKSKMGLNPVVVTTR